MARENELTREFVELLDRCKAQVEADPSGVIQNPHLYDLLDKIHLRLCHGNRPNYSVLSSVVSLDEQKGKGTAASHARSVARFIEERATESGVEIKLS